MDIDTFFEEHGEIAEACSLDEYVLEQFNPTDLELLSVVIGIIEDRCGQQDLEKG